jgi:hypothetical protein
MANVGGGWMADYDVVPLALPACAELSNGGAFTTHEGFTPALVSASANEYLRVSRLFGTIPWKEHSDGFQFQNKPHVSDMLALRYLVGNGDVKVFSPRHCGLVSAADVFDSAGGVRCRDSCPHLHQVTVVDGGHRSIQSNTTGFGPLGAHFSHLALLELSRTDVAISSSAGDGRWLPSNVAKVLSELTIMRQRRTTIERQSNTSFVRGRLLTLSPGGYRSACPHAITGRPGAPLGLPTPQVLEPAHSGGSRGDSSALSKLVRVGNRHEAVLFPPSVDATSVLGSAEDPLPMLVPSTSLPHNADVPFFFHEPKAAGTTIETILVVKNKWKTLPAGDLEDLAYIERSQALQRKIIAYLKTPLLYDACAMLGRSKLRARAFTILREPVGRIVSLFWYLKYSTWEKSFDQQFRDQSMDIFLKGSERDWLVYSLAGAVVPKGEPGFLGLMATTEDVYAAARFVLMERMEVGFMDDMEHSMAMLFAAFGWPWTPGDVNKLSRNVNTGRKAIQPAPGANSTAVAALAVANKAAASAEKKKDDSMASYLPRIAELNEHDIRLYTEARLLYDERKALVRAQAEAGFGP